MAHSRRQFLLGAAGALALLPGLSAQESSQTSVFQHGVASGDPLHDRVILWTRVTSARPNAPVPIYWMIGEDPDLSTVTRWGIGLARPARDHTFKVDVSGLRPDTTYYYSFWALGQTSAIGRTRTIPDGTVDSMRFAVASCANYPAGFFNVYGLIARQDDLNAVLHLGDYIYEYGDGAYGDGAEIGRTPAPNKEIVTLSDYRTRHAQYKTDPQLQAAHARHPFIAIWDDHEFTDDAWTGGALNHNPDEGEGSWTQRLSAAQEAYFEWMPIREAETTDATRLYRHFACGDLLDLLIVDTRMAGREEQAEGSIDELIIDIVEGEGRQILGETQEAWLFDKLQASQEKGATWRLLGQQVVFSHLRMAAELHDMMLIDQRLAVTVNVDQWDGYEGARERFLNFVEEEGIDNLVVLTGDIHSSWGLEVSQDPYDPEVYDPETSEGALAVEYVTPGVTSHALDAPDVAGFAKGVLEETQPHLRYVDLLRQGYLLIDVNRDEVQGTWYYTPDVRIENDIEIHGHTLAVKSGTSHLEDVTRR